MILGAAIYETLHANENCWIYSDFAYRQLAGSQNESEPNGRSLAIVSNFVIPPIGELDLAIFDQNNLLVAVECDGHAFHERTHEQASRDKRRDRIATRLGVQAMRFTGTDVVRNSTECAQEVVDFVGDRLKNYRH
jgi:hypothetical protein